MISVNINFEDEDKLKLTNQIIKECIVYLEDIEDHYLAYVDPELGVLDNLSAQLETAINNYTERGA